MEYRVIRHSAKGSTWEDHKYIKRIDGTYYYPDDYVGGRHLPKGEGGESDDSSKSTYGEYTKGDSDFDEKNYSDKNRLGDTDFYGFKRDDGSVVILEEDMKWVLPKGTEITPELIQRLESFDKTMEEKRNNGQNYTSKDWERMAKEAINGSSSAEGEKDIEGLAKEVIRGNFGNGAQRKELLGNAYQEIQDRVNEILKIQKSSTSSKSTTNNEEDEKRKKLSNNKKKANIKPYYGNYEPPYKTDKKTVKHSDSNNGRYYAVERTRL